MDIKPEKMKLDIRQVSNPLYLGNVGDILHPKSPKVAAFVSEKMELWTPDLKKQKPLFVNIA